MNVHNHGHMTRRHLARIRDHLPPNHPALTELELADAHAEAAETRQDRDGARSCDLNHVKRLNTRYLATLTRLPMPSDDLT